MSDVADEERRQRMLDTRDRLVRVLSDIAGAAAAQSLVRCPYRTREDVCTFRGGCRNQIVSTGEPRRCNGGVLDPTPASAEDREVAEFA